MRRSTSRSSGHAAGADHCTPRPRSISDDATVGDAAAGDASPPSHNQAAIARTIDHPPLVSLELELEPEVPEPSSVPPDVSLVDSVLDPLADSVAELSPVVVSPPVTLLSLSSPAVVVGDVVTATDVPAVETSEMSPTSSVPPSVFSTMHACIIADDTSTTTAHRPSIDRQS